MDVTTPIVAFIFVCLIFPRLVRHRPQFYAALGMVVIILLIQAIGGLVDPLGSFARFMRVLAGCLQLVTFILLVLCAGGLSLHELTGEMRNAFEVIRRGEEEKEIIIPIGDQKNRVSPARADEEAPRQRYEINEPAPAAPPPAPAEPAQPGETPKREPGSAGPLPLE